MRVLLVRPYPGKSSYTSSYGIITPPLGLLSLAGAVRDLVAVAVLDAEALRFRSRDTAKMIADLDPDVVGFTSISSVYYPYAVEVMKYVRRELKDTVYVVGGHHATFMYRTALRDGFDAVVVGEGEETFREMLLGLKEVGSFKGVRGLAYLEQGEVKYEPRGLIQDLDKLPYPAYDLVNPDLYKAGIFGDERIASVETSRGCPYNCDFCGVTAMWGHTWRSKSTERVLRELELLEKLRYRWVFIVDDNFIVPHKLEDRKSLLKALAEKGIGKKLKFIVQIRADIVTKHPEIAKLLYDAGVRVAFIGIESGDPEVLRGMKKGLLPSDVARGIGYLSASGIVTHGGLVIGAPYETSNQRHRSLKYALGLMYHGLDSLQVSIYTPIPGSAAFYRALKSSSLLTIDWRFYDALNPVMRTLAKPWKLFFESRLTMYLFYFAKWLRGKVKALPNFKKGYDDTINIVSKSVKYLAKKVPEHILLFFTLPLESLVTEVKVRRSAFIPRGLSRGAVKHQYLRLTTS